MTELKWEDVKKMTFKEIESRQVKMDYASYLTDSKPLREIYLKVSTFELEDSFSIRLSLLLEESFFNGFDTSKEREQFIKKFGGFPKLKVFKSVDGQDYKIVNLIRHSTKILEVKLALYKIENLALEDLPYRISSVWNDILDRFS